MYDRCRRGHVNFITNIYRNSVVFFLKSVSNVKITDQLVPQTKQELDEFLVMPCKHQCKTASKVLPRVFEITLGD